MKHRFLTLLALLLTVSAAVAATYRPEDVPNVHIKDSRQYVSNPDGVLTAQTVDSLNALLADVWASSSAEPVVVALGNIDEAYTPDQFATELFSRWGIGKSDKDNGLLVLIIGDARRYVVRTGRGTSAVLPDVLAGRIMRHKAVPLFKEGDLSAGTMAAVREMASALTDPEAADAIRSRYANDANPSSGGDDEMSFFTFMLWAGAGAGVVSLVWVIWVIAANRRRDELQRYRALNDIKPMLMFLTFAGMAMPLPALLICLWKMKRLRDHGRSCPNCSHAMHKLDEQTDNKYLTPAQDLEERLDSIDYDVWLCDNCGEKDVIPYVNRSSAFTTCEHCGARTATLSGNRIISQPTTRSEGHGVKIYDCRNCGKQTLKPYNIAKIATPPVVIIPGGGRGGGFGGGGFSGGSFGGGSTSGGGVSGGW